EEAVKARYAYDEAAIVSTAIVDLERTKVVSSNTAPAKNIERWVAMTKLLHISKFQDVKGKWLFARGKFDQAEVLNYTASKHEIHLEANFNAKLTRSAVLVDSKKVGEIYFALG